jgi:ribosomal protein L37AE/L43A
MMQNIVRLAEYRSRRRKARAWRAASAPEAGAQYVCTRCDADQFKLSAAGMVHCAHCGAQMRNLAVSTPPAVAPPVNPVTRT